MQRRRKLCIRVSSKINARISNLIFLRFFSQKTLLLYLLILLLTTNYFSGRKIFFNFFDKIIMCCFLCNKLKILLIMSIFKKECLALCRKCQNLSDFFIPLSANRELVLFIFLNYLNRTNENKRKHLHFDAHKTIEHKSATL